MFEASKLVGNLIIICEKNGEESLLSTHSKVAS